MNPTNKPPFYIFLDIDGVLLHCDDQQRGLKKPSAKALAYVELHEEHLRKEPNAYSNNYGSLIVTHYFSPGALANLQVLIQKVEKVAQPMIVISSAWRESHTVKELKEIYFGMHSFSKYIVDKTGEDSTRAEEIQHWLDEHSVTDNYVVLDDDCYKMQEYFGTRFIQINNDELLVKGDVEKALIANELTTPSSGTLTIQSNF